MLLRADLRIVPSLVFHPIVEPLDRADHAPVELVEIREAPPISPPSGPTQWLFQGPPNQLYGLRKETVESVFGIIKQAIGFWRFLLRGKEKVGLELTLMTTSYNLKRLFKLGMQIKRA